jgi:hypothetical protein
MTRYVREDVAHVWAHQLQSHARNKRGNFYFQGDTIYSYGSHFPIAKHVEHKGEEVHLVHDAHILQYDTWTHVRDEAGNSIQC